MQNWRREEGNVDYGGLRWSELLQPGLGPRDARGFHAITRAQLADRFGKIIPHRAVGEPSRRSTNRCARRRAAFPELVPLATWCRCVSGFQDSSDRRRKRALVPSSVASIPEATSRRSFYPLRSDRAARPARRHALENRRRAAYERFHNSCSRLRDWRRSRPYSNYRFA